MVGLLRGSREEPPINSTASIWAGRRCRKTAKRLVEFKDRNHELVDILARMHATGLKATLISDQAADRSTF